MTAEPDVIVVGAGLAGLVATHELVKAGRRVLVLDQENRNNLGGQAFWSLGGLFFVDSPEQRRLGIKDSYDLAMQDWLGSAGFDRDREDYWPRQWAEAYVQLRRDREAAVPLRPRACGSRRSWAGPSAATGARPGTGTRYRASTSPGAPGRRSSGCSASRCSTARSAVWSRFSVPPPGRRPDRRGRRGRRRPRHGARALAARPGQGVLARGRRRVRAARQGGDHHLGRDRRQPRPGAGELAHRPARPGAASR